MVVEASQSVRLNKMSPSYRFPFHTSKSPKKKHMQKNFRERKREGEVRGVPSHSSNQETRKGVYSCGEPISIIRFIKVLKSGMSMMTESAENTDENIRAYHSSYWEKYAHSSHRYYGSCLTRCWEKRIRLWEVQEQATRLMNYWRVWERFVPILFLMAAGLLWRPWIDFGEKCIQKIKMMGRYQNRRWCTCNAEYKNSLIHLCFVSIAASSSL